MSDPIEAPDVGSFDDARFRQVLGHFPTGVTIITAVPAEGQPVGMAVGSFFSVSLEPPMVGFGADRSSNTWANIRECGHFCVSVLAHDQEEVCRNFATKREDKFAGIGWRASGYSGAPVIEGALAWIDCDLEDHFEAGDHHLVVGRVRALDVDESHAGGPLLFYRGGYGRFEA